METLLGVITPLVDGFVSHLYLHLFLLVVLAVGFYLWPILFSPLDRLRQIGDVEKDMEGGRFFNHVGPGKRKFGKGTPPVFPNGWFKLIDSHRLKKGESRYVACLGQHLAVFRGEDGVARVIDAYCPHLGANLGVGGKVKDCIIECPFHGWQFDETGKCVKIPYSDRIPSIAHTRVWPSIEMTGAICFWFDAEDRPPSWEPPRLPDFDTFKFHGRTEHHIRGHVQEIPENGADTAHLNILHQRTPVLSQLPVRHQWDAKWEPGKEPEGHLAHAVVKEKIVWRGMTIPGTYQEANITQVGPGLVYLQFSTFFGRLVILEAVTPLEPFHMQVDHTVFAESKVPRWFAKFVLRVMSGQFERDVPIWNSKTYLSSPMIVKGDGRIIQFRKWFSQFYSEHSPTLESLKETSLEW